MTATDPLADELQRRAFIVETPAFPPAFRASLAATWAQGVRLGWRLGMPGWEIAAQVDALPVDEPGSMAARYSGTSHAVLARARWAMADLVDGGPGRWGEAARLEG